MHRLRIWPCVFHCYVQQLSGRVFSRALYACLSASRTCAMMPFTWKELTWKHASLTFFAGCSDKDVQNRCVCFLRCWIQRANLNHFVLRFDSVRGSLLAPNIGISPYGREVCSRLQFAFGAPCAHLDGTKQRVYRQPKRNPCLVANVCPKAIIHDNLGADYLILIRVTDMP